MHTDNTHTHAARDERVHLLLLELSDGVLCLFQTLAGHAALLPDHRQLPLDDVVLLGFLRPRHLTLRNGDMAAAARGSVGGQPVMM